MSVVLTLITAVVAIISVKLFVRYRKFRKFVKTIDKIPGPKSYPFFGNTLGVLRVHRDGRWQWFRDLCTRYGEKGIFRTWLGNRPNIHLTSAEAISVIMPNKNLITKSAIYDYVHPWLGSGLLTSTGEKWHRQRKLITPTFHFNILEHFGVVMSEKAEILKECIKSEYEKDPKKPIDMFVWLTRCALDIICESAMGININAQTDVDSEYSVALHSITVQAVERMFRPWLAWDRLYYLSHHGRRFKRNVEIAHKFTNQVIRERKSARALQTQNSDECYDEDKPKRRAFLDHLLDACERDNTPLTDDELREEVDTFLFAGHDTTAAAMSWALFSLGNHPDIQDKIHQEQLEVFGDSTEPATLHQISELKYLERVIKETLRLFPSAPSVGRFVTEEIEIAGYKIPEQASVSVQIHRVHHDPKYWKNPDKFDPDRFLPENSQGRHPYAYVPFSAGPRNCIGQKFALLEQKIVLTAILRSWRVKSHLKFEDAKMYSEFILRPQDGIKIYFSPKDVFIMSIILALITTVLAVIIIKLLQRYIEFRRFVKIIDKIPGPKGYPVVGNMLDILHVSREGRWKWFCNLSSQYTDAGIFRTWLGPVAHINLISPETAAVVMSSKTLITKSMVYDFLYLWLRTGLLTGTGDKWYRHRKLITPTFHFNILEQFEVVMTEKAEILKRCIESELKNDPKKSIDVFAFMTRCALDIICESAMGININAQMTSQKTEYSEALHNITIQAMDRILRPWLYIDRLYYMTSHGKTFKRTVDTIHKFADQVIKEKRLARERQKQNPDEEISEDKPKRRAFLDHLLDACERDNTPLTDDELKEEVNTFMFAGHDTTAAAMSWALFSIGNHPEVQEKIHQEQLEVFGDSTEPATPRQISELKYLERVIKETLRMFPSAPGVSRTGTEDLEIGEYKIPKGAVIAVQIHRIHHDPRHWPDPERFDPDRFLPENSQGRHPYAYVPFSAGLRNCIGQKYAMLEQKIVLTAVLRSWRVKSHAKFEEAAIHSDIILRPQNGVHIYFTPK
ncbi:uncharacterized protein LOC105688649 [Athalia rosae]|uniref:uncharacterized protein LOC105688649 n=1 Tax=Athalia rosae TaxID=37344 RepID=UPI00203381A0|nr:uncharacterized protein LOC105688649 [Athalia rosae]